MKIFNSTNRNPVYMGHQTNTKNGVLTWGSTKYLVGHLMEWRSILGIMAFFNVFFMGAQDLPVLRPPSPTAFELGKYGDIPINESTGTANISIPLFEYNVGKLSVPISLSYATSGVMVDQIASWVGMGWNLNAGGVITREVRGMEDEEATYREFPSKAFIQSLHSTSDSDYYSFMVEVEQYDANNTDYQPDIYNYSFGNYSGSFVLDQNMEPMLLKQDPSITLVRQGNGFKFTMPNGTIYLFDVVETTKSRNSCAQDDVQFHNSAWYLGEIQNYNGDIIYFDYVLDNMLYDSAYNESVTKITGSDCPSVSNGTNYSECSVTAEVNAQKLSKIWNNRNDETIDFISSSSRADMSSGGLKLNDIVLKIGQDEIKSYSLDNSFVSSSVATNNTSMDVSTNATRMFLFGIDEKDVNGNTVNGKKYSFTYNDPTALPPRFSYAQDLLGYYNGKNSNQSLLPPQEYPNASTPPYTYGDRTSDFSYASKGVLQKVIYPTGGETEITYEPSAHIITNSSYETRPGGVFASTDSNFGSIVNSRVINDVAYSQPIYLSATLSDNNMGIGENIHKRMYLTIEDLTDGSVLLDSVNISIQSSPFNQMVSFKKGHSYEVTVDLTPVINLEPGEVVEGEVVFDYIYGEYENDETNYTGLRVEKLTSDEGSNQIPIVKTYYYNTLENYQSENTPTARLQTFSIIDYKPCIDYVMDPQDPGWTEVISGSYREFSVSSGGWGAIHDYRNRLQNKYQFVTTSFGGNNFEGGAVEKEFYVFYDSEFETFGKEDIPNRPISNVPQFSGDVKNIKSFKNENGSLTQIQEKSFIYGFDESKTIKLDAYLGLNQYPSYQITTPSQATSVSTYYYILNQYPIYSKRWNLESETQKNIYPSDEISVTKYLHYDNDDHSFPTRSETVDSRGSSITSTMVYPEDVDAPVPTEVQGLISEHRLGELLEKSTVVENNGELLSSSAKVTQYGNWNGQILPQDILTVKNAAVESRVVYHEYDEYDNPVQVSKTDGPPTYYVWGYHGKYPIAEIVNADYNAMSTLQKTLISEIKTASNSDVDNCREPACLEEVLREKLSDLREEFPDSQVTTYTFDPLVGITSMSDPRGQTVYYEYDEFNRLKAILDHDGNLMNDYQYHYRSNP